MQERTCKGDSRKPYNCQILTFIRLSGLSEFKSGPSLLRGSWLLISRVISRVTILITHIRGLITLQRTLNPKPFRALKGTLNPLITTHEPSSYSFKCSDLDPQNPATLSPEAPNTEP